MRVVERYRIADIVLYFIVIGNSQKPGVTLSKQELSNCTITLYIGSMFERNTAKRVLRGLGNDARRHLLRDGLHHADTLTVRTDPGRAVRNTPFVFLKTFLADLEATRATPAKLLFLVAAMTAVFAELSTTISGLFGIFTHFFNS